MKKLLFTLAALLMAASAFAGHTVTFTPSEFEPTEPGEFTLTKDGVTIHAQSGMVTADNFRFYADSYLYFTHVYGELMEIDGEEIYPEAGILEIQFVCEGQNNAKYGPGKLYLQKEGIRGNYSYDGYIGLWQDGWMTDEGYEAIGEEAFEEGMLGAICDVEFYANAQVRCTEINVYVRGEGEVTPPTPPTPGYPTAAPTFNGYTEDGIHAYFVEIKQTEPSTIYYRVQVPDGSWTDWAEYTEILSFTGNGKYRVEAYAVAPGKDASTEIAYEFVVSPFTGIDEMNADKQVANVRYFNMAGQEMQQANGLTIMVTTYTDGTTNAVKVVK